LEYTLEIRLAFRLQRGATLTEARREEVLSAGGAGLDVIRGNIQQALGNRLTTSGPGSVNLVPRLTA
jgi:hypothetical protein